MKQRISHEIKRQYQGFCEAPSPDLWGWCLMSFCLGVAFGVLISVLAVHREKSLVDQFDVPHSLSRSTYDRH